MEIMSCASVELYESRNITKVNQNETKAPEPTGGHEGPQLTTRHPQFMDHSLTIQRATIGRVRENPPDFGCM